MKIIFDELDESLFIDNTIKSNINTIDNYDNTTTETYRVKRLYKIDPFDDNIIPDHLIFEFKSKWNPYSGIRTDDDEIGPLCFNALGLYKYYFENRYRELWSPPTADGFGSMYGPIVGKSIEIKINSLTFKPEKYLFRLPIYDCYLKKSHKLTTITMGPVLTDEEIEKIDTICKLYHPKKNHLIPLSLIKSYYLKSLETNPNHNLPEIQNFILLYPSFEIRDINEKYNTMYVDILVRLK